MPRILIALKMCLSMFTVLPISARDWEEDLRKPATACLPLAGLLIGLLWWGIAALARWLLPGLLAAAVIAAFPFLITGFIHLDGFMDTSDAMLSWREREQRLKILKDVHVGSFSVVALALLMLFQFASAAELRALFPLVLIPVLSRCGSALSVLTLTPLGHSEYAVEDETPRVLVKCVKYMALCALLLLLLFSGLRGLLCGAAVVGAYVLSMRWCVNTLGGVSGDLAGFALTLSELCGLIVLAIF